MPQKSSCRHSDLVKTGVEGIEIAFVQLVGCNTKRLAKPLIMYDLAHAQELDGLLYIGIVAEAQDVVVGGAGLLLRYGFAGATLKIPVDRYGSFL